MSDSNHSAAISNGHVTGVTGPTSLEHSTSGHGSPAPPSTAPKSSPPLLASAHDTTALPNVPFLEPNGTHDKHDAAAENDSEAETLISSPVKKREALKKAKAQHNHSNSRADPHTTNGQDAAESRRRDDGRRRGQSQAPDEESLSVEGNAAHAANGVLAQSGDESDNLSDVPSVRSTFAHLEAKRSTSADSDDDDEEQSGSSDDGSSEADGEGEDKREGRDQDDSHGDLDARGRGHGASNPRKRKYRESYMPASMEPPRRRRRASDEADPHASGDNGDRAGSPSPKLRRHRRTASTQSNWTDANRSGSVTNGTGAPASGRQRRAATHFPVRDSVITRNNWDSDTSSEASHHHHLNRLTRNINRSVSTPGRPMGRDHKRHVNKYGFTRLAEACENGDLDLVKEWREKDPEQLEQREFAGNTPLQVASLNGYPEIVSYLLAEKCNPHTANTDQDTPLIDAVENGHVDVVRLLLQAGVNPLRQNLKGQQALDVVTEETENAQDIRSALREAIEAWRKDNENGSQQQKEAEITKRPGPVNKLHFLAYTASNLLRLAGENDRDGIIELLQSQVEVNNEIVAAAAKTGDTFTVSMLLAEIKPKDAKKKPELPLLAVIGTSHFEMVKYLTGADRFNPTWRSRSNGMTWYELAEHRQGPNWKQEKDLLKQLYDERTKTERLSSSPVSRRENGKRRRSVPRQPGSDIDMEDLDSNDQARSRRRLVSKKVMRQSSKRRTSFSSSDDDDEDGDNHSVSVASSKAQSPSIESLKPPIVRKVGRPRKASAPNAIDARKKRRRSSPVHEQTSRTDIIKTAPSAGPLDESDGMRHERKIKIEDSERPRIEKADLSAESKAAAELEATRQMELQAKAEAQAEAEKLAQEQRKAEEAKKKAEDARRKEAERKAEEIRLQHQRRMAEERRLKEEKQIKALPSALQHVLGMTGAAKSEKQKYIQRHFLPVQVVKRSDLGPSVEGEGKADELWMLTYQAAAILTNTGAAELLDLPADPQVKRSSMTGIDKLETTLEQRRAMLPCLQSSSLVHTCPSDKENMPLDDLVAELAMAEKTRLQIAEDRSKFLTMTPLRWIRFRDFYSAATATDCMEYSHLSGLDMVMRFDCCLDSTPFAGVGTSNKSNKCVNLSRKDEVDGKVSTRNGFGGSASVQRAGPGVTTFTIVQD